MTEKRCSASDPSTLTVTVGVAATLEARLAQQYGQAYAYWLAQMMCTVACKPDDSLSLVAVQGFATAPSQPGQDTMNVPTIYMAALRGLYDAYSVVGAKFNQSLVHMLVGYTSLDFERVLQNGGESTNVADWYWSDATSPVSCSTNPNTRRCATGEAPDGSLAWNDLWSGTDKLQTVKMNWLSGPTTTHIDAVATAGFSILETVPNSIKTGKDWISQVVEQEKSLVQDRPLPAGVTHDDVRIAYDWTGKNPTTNVQNGLLVQMYMDKRH